ncbi:MAG: class I SAM-dependent methyltransferase [Desulfobacterales bacterium]|nr:class I SAM-dependent methyltransferase [Desulfobacterales bacterium]
MNERTREIIKKIVPKLCRYKLKNTLRNLKTLKARRVFEISHDKPEWLGKDMLKYLQEKYPYPRKISYDPKSLEKKGEYHAKAILGLFGKQRKKIHTILELGCGAGMVSCALQHKGRVSIPIDIRSGFDERAVREEVPFFKMDAAQLGFKDESFDIVFSLAAFEHFNEPDLVLKEATRVVRTGGYIYLHFGPLYMSHFGLHAYRSITVPYCQFLFQEELLMNFCIEKNLKPPDFSSVNKWSLEDYRELWARYSSKLRRIKYYEYLNVDHVNLIVRHSSCFKSKTKNFNNLVVPELEVLFQKIR